jgi:hypothetical protein
MAKVPKAQKPKAPKEVKPEIKEDTAQSEGIRGYKAAIITVGLIAFIYVVVDSRIINSN